MVETEEITAEQAVLAERMDRLDYLLQSETIQDVDEGRCTPNELDQAIKRLKNKVKELTQLRYLDQSEIVRLRRQIERDENV